MKIFDLRKKVLSDINNLRLKQIWRVAETLDEENEQDEASEWLKNKEQEKEKLLEKEKRLEKIKNINKPTVFNSDQLGTITFNVSQNGVWPQDPGESPEWFPIKSDDISSKVKFTEIFKKKETWDALQQASKNPNFSSVLQNWLLPKVILLLGKPWWDHNKAVPNLKGAPFGLFDDETRRNKRSVLDQLPQGRAWIYTIQNHIARILGQYLSTKGPGDNTNIAGYINTVLNRSMVNAAGKVNDRVSVRVPVCGYCRYTRKLKTPPTLEYDSFTGLYRCPNCAQELEMTAESLQEEKEDVQESSQTNHTTVTHKKDDEKTKASLSDEHSKKPTFSELLSKDKQKTSSDAEKRTSEKATSEKDILEAAK